MEKFDLINEQIYDNFLIKSTIYFHYMATATEHVQRMCLMLVILYWQHCVAMYGGMRSKLVCIFVPFLSLCISCVYANHVTFSLSFMDYCDVAFYWGSSRQSVWRSSWCHSSYTCLRNCLWNPSYANWGCFKVFGVLWETRVRYTVCLQSILGSPTSMFIQLVRV